MPRAKEDACYSAPQVSPHLAVRIPATSDALATLSATLNRSLAHAQRYHQPVRVGRVSRALADTVATTQLATIVESPATAPVVEDPATAFVATLVLEALVDLRGPAGQQRRRVRFHHCMEPLYPHSTQQLQSPPFALRSLQRAEVVCYVAGDRGHTETRFGTEYFVNDTVRLSRRWNDLSERCVDRALLFLGKWQ